MQLRLYSKHSGLECYQKSANCIRMRGFVGEFIHGNYASVVHSAGCNSITQYELWKRELWSSLNDGNFLDQVTATKQQVAGELCAADLHRQSRCEPYRQLA